MYSTYKPITHHPSPPLPITKKGRKEKWHFFIAKKILTIYICISAKLGVCVCVDSISGNIFLLTSIHNNLMSPVFFWRYTKPVVVKLRNNRVTN